MSILSLHLFNLYLLHSLHTNRRVGGGGGGLNIFYRVILFSFLPTLLISLLTLHSYVCIESVISYHCFGEAGGKEKYYRLSFYEGKGWAMKEVSAKNYISFYLSVFYVILSLCLSMPVCLVFI